MANSIVVGRIIISGSSSIMRVRNILAVGVVIEGIWKHFRFFLAC